MDFKSTRVPESLDRFIVGCDRRLEIAEFFLSGSFLDQRRSDGLLNLNGIPFHSGGTSLTGMPIRERPRESFAKNY